jgi:CRISPR/Cas system CSM-associated protein Csm2 small subunit
MSTKSEWYSKSNEKEPGNPLSRMPEWDRRFPSAISLSTAELRIRELLAVIDRQEEKAGKTVESYQNIVDSLRVQLAAAEEEKREPDSEVEDALQFFEDFLRRNSSHDIGTGYMPMIRSHLAKLRSRLAAAEERSKTKAVRTKALEDNEQRLFTKLAAAEEEKPRAFEAGRALGRWGTPCTDGKLWPWPGYASFAEYQAAQPTEVIVLNQSPTLEAAKFDISRNAPIAVFEPAKKPLPEPPKEEGP